MIQHVYLAGPFFNDVQKLHIDRVKESCKRYKVPFFSPKDEGGILKPKPTPEERRQILDSNRKGIRESGFVLAVLDWLMPTGQQLRVVSHDPALDQYKVLSPPLNLPDAGTVWEMGFAVAVEVPVVGLRLDPKGHINVMLAESVHRVIDGYTEVDAIIQHYGSYGSLPPKGAVAWRGEVQ